MNGLEDLINESDFEDKFYDEIEKIIDHNREIVVSSLSKDISKYLKIF
jgi:hypothetical protein